MDRAMVPMNSHDQETQAVLDALTWEHCPSCDLPVWSGGAMTGALYQLPGNTVVDRFAGLRPPTLMYVCPCLHTAIVGMRGGFASLPMRFDFKWAGA